MARRRGAISERIPDETEAASEESRTSLEQVVDNLEEYVFTYEQVADGSRRALYRSPQQRRVFGGEASAIWTDEELLAWIHPDDHDAFARYAEALEAGRPAEMEVRLTGLDGVERRLWFRARTRRVPDGRLLVDGVASDVTARRRIEGELREAERTLAGTVRRTGMYPFQTHYFEDGTSVDRYIGPNEAALLGGRRPPSQPATTAFLNERVHVDDRERVSERYRIERLRRGRRFEIEYRLLGYDDRVRWVRVISNPHPQPDGSVVVDGVAVDVTERRRLADSQQRLFDVVQAIGAHLYRGDLHADGTWVETFTGPGEHALLGFRPDRSLPPGAAWDEAVHADDRHAAHTGLFAKLSAGRVVETEYRLVQPDGSVRWVRDTSMPRQVSPGLIALDGVVVDISEQRALHGALSDTRHRLELALEAADEFVYAGEKRTDGSYEISCSGPIVERWLGRPGVATDDFLALWGEHVHPDDAEAYAKFEALTRDERISSDLEYRLRSATGEERWIWHRARVRDEDARHVFEGVLIDISEQRRGREELERARLRLETVLPAIDEILFEVELDESARVLETYVSAPPQRLLGGGDELPPLLERVRVHLDDRERYDAFLERLLGGEEAVDEMRLPGPDGTSRWLRISARPRPRTGGGVIVAGVLADVTARRRWADELQAARDDAELRSRTDSLTGLYNRRHGTDVLRQELARGERHAGSLGIVMVDVDYFKEINDTHGHRAGDDVLIELGARVRSGVRSYDTVARWGGEEICVLLPDVADDAHLMRIAQTIRMRVSAEPFGAGGYDVPVTVSVGGVRATAAEWSADAVIDAADRALYGAKRRGRNRVCLFSELTVQDLVAGEPEAIRIAQALALSTSMREGMPAAHSEEVATLAAATAEQLGLPAVLVLRCRLAGWLHDVGKLAVPDEILTRGGPLNDGEWEVMRNHAPAGAQIVAHISSLAETAAAVRHHHERIDGGGYPDGLAGEAIPIEARIVAVADAYSAMTARRPYRGPVAHGAALAELDAHAGAQFDVVVVAAFARAAPDPQSH